MQSADSIFHDKDSGILFATFKYVGYDYAGDMERMRENPKVREWWAMTDGFQEVRNSPPLPFQSMPNFSPFFSLSLSLETRELPGLG